MTALQTLVENINGVLWGVPMMVLLVGFGVLSTLYLGFPQFTKIGIGFKEAFGGIFKKEEVEEGSMSSFQSLATAVAAQVGTGNIGGVATALASGGPGAIFWMWITALVGMATISVEATLAQKYRIRGEDGQLVGGPAFYLRQGLEDRGMAGLGKFLAAVFAVLIVLALGFVGNMVQSNSIATTVSSAFNIPTIAIGVVIAILAALIFVGGMQRIAKFTEMVVPIMAAIYIIAAILALVIFRNHMGETFRMIFSQALSGKAIGGGVMGYTMRTAIRYGVARGLFSNEAGMGSTPNSHAVADVAHPVVQATVAMVGVFIDTILVCSATALVIISTGAYTADFQGAEITMHAFDTVFGPIGGKFIAVALTFFAMTTIVGWYYFGEGNIKYLFGDRGAVRVYQIAVIVFIILGSILEVAVVWELADMFNALMVIPNVIGITLLLAESKRIFKDYDQQVASGQAIHFDYEYENRK